MGERPTELIRQQGGSEHLSVQAARLEVTRGPDKGQVRQLSGGGVVVGTDPDCDLVLRDGSVSRRQFEVRSSTQGFALRDLGSTNGTFIGKLRVREALLVERAKIRVGRTELTFEPLATREEYLLSAHHRFGNLVGQSAAMRRCFALLEQAAASDSTVLIEGESGTGKELAAESVHRQSSRADGPLVVVDCGAIPVNLIESELFGHEKGAFTGADNARVGAFASANGGTLFLDEVGEFDLAMQPRLLRFLEKREVRRVGGNEVDNVDVRVVAATNRRLETLVHDGGFREDLFYRLAVIRVQLPPLRQRPDDIPTLALELARHVRGDVDAGTWLDDHTLAVLASHSWPGNVRELRNVLERLAALPDLDATELIGTSQGTSVGPLSQLSYHDAKQRVLDGFEKKYVETLLAEEDHVVARAAERAGVPRQTFFRLIKKHGLRGA